MKNFYAKALTILALLCVTMFSALATTTSSEQSPKKTYKGIVIGSDDNAPLAGVVIHVKENPKIVTTTNADGEYTLSVPADAKTIVFSMMGYDDKEISTANPYLFTLVTMIIQKSALE